MSELLLGCGNNRAKKLYLEGQSEWTNLVTLDIDEDCKPDVVHNLDRTPWPFEDNTFSEVHAYEVLEHLGKQGDFISFFDHFYEIWRILKPDGRLFATTPMWDSLWAWSDPGHTRIISKGSLTFLTQEEYTKQLGKTAMTDYRGYWKGDFIPEYIHPHNGALAFILRANK